MASRRGRPAARRGRGRYTNLSAGAAQQPEHGEVGRSVPNKQPDDIREKLLLDIRTDLKEPIADMNLQIKYKDELKGCIWDLNGKYETILHWIVNRVDFLDEMKKDDQGLIEAAEVVITLAMTCDDKLVGKADKRGETALHQAISSDKPKVLKLARRMCERGADSTAVQKAIASTNRLGENCLHLAITRHLLDIAMTLIPIADESAFCQRRASKDEDRTVPGGGNTPLHDAVRYDRCVFPEPDCAEAPGGEPCERCGKAKELVYDHVISATELVKSLVDRCDKALRKKNANDESPHLYHLRTQKNYQQTAEKGGFHTRLDLGAGRTDGFSARPGQHKPSTQASQGSCGRMLNIEAATYIQEYLVESAFTIGGFEDACACFFGDESDEGGRSWPFRPGYPITTTSYKAYENLIPRDTSVLSQVDLQIGQDTAGIHKPPAPSVAYAEGTSTTLQRGDTLTDEELQRARNVRWNKDMKALMRVFDMLWKRGVKRILKVTVSDNERRPCSDKVIQTCLSSFDVRYLDWNKPDLCIDVVYAACPRIAELTLYASGRKAVLRSWAGKTGLCSLSQLTHLTINPVKDLEECDDFIAAIKFFKTELTQNMMLTRWKLWLMSERKKVQGQKRELEASIADGEVMLQAFKQRKGKPEVVEANLLKLQEERKRDTEELEHVNKMRPELDCQLRRIEKKEESLEKQRRAMLLASVEPRKTFGDEAPVVDGSDRDRADRGGSKPGSVPESGDRPDVGDDDEAGASIDDSSYDSDISTVVSESARKPREPWLLSRDDDFTKPPEWTKLKLFTALGTDYDDYTYAAWNFRVTSQSVEELPSDLVGTSTGGTKDGIDINQIHTTIETNRWLKAVEEFVEKRVQTTEARDEDAIRVALIDDGVDVSQFDGAVRYPGWPPAKPTSTDKLWCHSEKGHGTVMAKMIQKMCPRVQLFVAKLGGDDDITKDDTASRAAEAIRWAIGRDVHIISMSWSLVKTDGNSKGIIALEKWIKEAATARKILYCAAADKGPYEDGAKIYPHSSDTSAIRVVGSAKEGGEESHLVDPKQVDYLFPGEGIRELDGKAGSSAATALAAGFAALILWCFKRHLPEAAVHAVADPDRMHDVFESLKTTDNKWVNVTRVLGVGGSATVESVVTYCTSAATLRTGNRGK